ncbi:uncharacterized protein si:dkey-192g7.3 isoform X3 [Scomber scombrus]|uniref:Uncharacterized protein si:dkey-192g7.3 isoform X3 n=1 Tax=Scomber scombrus TaxID=13677 RepID=A0AAV1NIF7_SCOSC|nr:uncharacterized protein si:dkey-192g7.3 isoform X1 [Scomber scombrus]
MRTFLGILMVFIVSGDEDINGVLDDSVLLPCSCPSRNLKKEFKWQMDKPETAKIFKQRSLGFNVFDDDYKSRAKMFLDENSNNCSLLLINITMKDQGKYRCTFSIDEQKTIIYINLSISEKQPLTGLESGPLSSQSACFMMHFKTIPILVTLGFFLM